MVHRILVLPEKQNMEAPAGANLLDALRQAGIFVNAPCGGNGTCGKCKVTVNGVEVLACDEVLLPLTQELTEKIEFLELASLPEFSRTFAKAMNFREETL